MTLEVVSATSHVGGWCWLNMKGASSQTVGMTIWVSMRCDGVGRRVVLRNTRWLVQSATSAFSSYIKLRPTQAMAQNVQGAAHLNADKLSPLAAPDARTALWQWARMRTSLAVPTWLLDLGQR